MLETAAVRFEQAGACAKDIVVTGAIVTGGSRYNIGFASCQTANCRSYDGADQAQLFTNVCVIACDLCALSSLAGLFT